MHGGIKGCAFKPKHVKRGFRNRGMQGQCIACLLEAKNEK